VLCLLETPSYLSAQKSADIDVTGPTIVAFFPLVADAELKSPNVNESLSDFQFYAGHLRQPLAERGITFKQVYARRFTIRYGTTSRVFATGKKVGYCLVAPEKEPSLQFGVMTDVGLLSLATNTSRGIRNKLRCLSQWSDCQARR
jgi:hypothetical protein